MPKSCKTNMDLGALLSPSKSPRFFYPKYFSGTNVWFLDMFYTINSMTGNSRCAYSQLYHTVHWHSNTQTQPRLAVLLVVKDHIQLGGECIIAFCCNCNWSSLLVSVHICVYFLRPHPFLLRSVYNKSSQNGTGLSVCAWEWFGWSSQCLFHL